MMSQVSVDRSGELSGRSWLRGSPSLLSSGIAVLVALAVGYLGVAVAVALVGASFGFKYLAIGIAYALVAIFGPVLLAIYLHGVREWSWRRSAGTGAAVCLGIHILLLPIALATMAM